MAKKKPQPSIDIAVSYGLSRRGLPSANRLREWAKAALAGHPKAVEMAIRLVDNDESQELNHQYRGKNYPTNVLSFPADLPDHIDLPLLGDLVLCAPVIANEAIQQNKLLSSHYAHMIVHGVLHLQGWDHENDADAEAMEQREREILAQLGIPDPYQTME